MTHLDTEYHFIKNKCVMIFGINDTDPGADSNGSGKSVLIEGATLAFTGSTCRDVDKLEFINDELQDCYIGLELENKLGEINNLFIERIFNRKKSAVVRITENSKLNEQITSVNEANHRINELIGLNKEDLLHFFIVGQSTNFSFLVANDTEKKAIISRLSNSDNIDKIIDKLKAKKKGLEPSLIDYENKISKLNGKIEVFENQIEEEKNQAKDKNKDQILEAKEKIKNLEISKKNHFEKIKSFESKIVKLDVESKSISKQIIETVDYNEKIDNFNEKIQSIKNEKREANHLIEHLESIEGGSISCPKCKHIFNPGSDVRIEEISALKEDLANQIESFDFDIKKYNIKIEKYSDKIKENKILKKSLESLNEDRREAKSEINDLLDAIQRIDKNIVRSWDDIKQLENAKTDGNILETLKTQIKILNKEIYEIKEQQKIIIDEIANYDYWIYHFGKKGFSSYLSNKSIKVIEGVTNSYLKKFSSDLQVSINGYTLLKSGDISEKINVNIVRNGRHIGSYNRYSGGEKGRINLANIVGIHKLINMSSKSGGLNFLALDEVFDGLDKTGQKDVIKTLEPLGITTLVVSHSNEPIGSDNELFIKKTDGISQIIK